MPDALISAHSTLRPLFDALPESIKSMARSLYRRLLDWRYGQLGLAEAQQNDRIWKLHPSVALRGQEQEVETARWFRTVIRPGMDVMDIGANVGQMTLEMAYLVGQKGRVIAVEPGPGNLDLLEKHVEGNGFSDRVIVVAAACSDQTDQTVKLKIFGDDSNVVGSGFSILDVPQTRSQELLPEIFIQVQTTTIDALCSTYAFRPAIIKIDVEGAELLTLMGAKATLATIRPIIHFGFHPFAFSDPEAASQRILSLLVEHNYIIESRDGQTVTSSLDMEEYVARPQENREK
ncbi:FkbM family methyltransferase [Oscillatoria sp. FACHB-1407]|uniref:FkbM family methyltransferase n=1 Tax=Oscillatoria sp. FACHB-1407 TaxID=2692847 RepID=UPI001685EF72|nr:FkbM family methyltransferase [Oscillatoria sp. FACHB-1407]MBD2459672.1 FkbM family methyltransferase [Oscillatoria sp. FACHB-1407]